MATTHLYHGFPKMIDDFGGYGVQTTIKGKDEVTRTLLRISGSINGKVGFFEYIYDANKICNHRLFVAL